MNYSEWDVQHTCMPLPQSLNPPISSSCKPVQKSDIFVCYGGTILDGWLFSVRNYLSWHEVRPPHQQKCLSWGLSRLTRQQWSKQSSEMGNQRSRSLFLTMSMTSEKEKKLPWCTEWMGTSMASSMLSQSGPTLAAEPCVLPWDINSLRAFTQARSPKMPKPSNLGNKWLLHLCQVLLYPGSHVPSLWLRLTETPSSRIVPAFWQYAVT